MDSKLLETATAPFSDKIVTSQILYKPGLLAAARVTFQGTRWEIHHEREIVKVVPFPIHSGLGEWETNLVPNWDNMNTRTTSEGICVYACDSTHDFSPERFEILQEEFIQFLISRETLEIDHNPYLKIHRKLDETEESFFERCLEKISDSFHQEMKTLEETILRQQDRFKERLDREVRELGADPLDLQVSLDPTQELSRPAKGRVESSTTTQEEMDVQESMMTIEDLRKQITELQGQKEEKIKESESNLIHLAKERQMDILRLNRTNVELLRFSLVWLPYTEFVIQEQDSRQLRLIQSF